METLDYIVKKYNIDITQPSPISIPFGRFKDIPRLFNELGFKVGAEIGVFEGEYSRYLLKFIPKLKLYGIDLWDKYPTYKDFEKVTLQEAYKKALNNTKKYDCELIKEWSHEAVKRFKDESLDFVFIDGNHAYEYVVQDIALWSKKVRKGGIVYGHDFDDYSTSRRWREMNVINAVEGWVKSYKINPWFIFTRNRNKSWLYVKD
jgi:hypothetical protein